MKLSWLQRVGPRAGGLRMLLLLFSAIALLIILPLTLSFSLFGLRYARYSREEIATTARLNVISARKITEMYQDTVIQAATLVLMDPALGEVGSLKRLDDVRGSFEAYKKLSRAVGLLTSMTYIGSLRIDSAYFYVDGADYIITSDQGAVRLGAFSDAGHRDVYEMLSRNPHASIWTVREIPISTISKDQKEMAAYLTYANMTNPIVSSVHGAIFVNIRESVISSLINTREFDEGGNTFIVDEEGKIVSHVDKTRILDRVAERADTAWLADLAAGRPAAPGGGGSLFVTAYSPKTSWTFVSVHSLTTLTAKIRALTRTSLIVILVIVCAGSTVVIYISSRISIPLRKLMRSLSQWTGGEGRVMPVNEFEYLLESFRGIQEQQVRLRTTIDDSRDKLWESYIVDLLRGERDKYAEDPFPPSRIIVEDGSFRVLTVSLDRRADVEARLSQEQRFSFLSLLSVECTERFSGGLRCIAVHMDGNVCVILSAAELGRLSADALCVEIASLQRKFAPMLGSTLSVGVSGIHGEDITTASRACDESLEALSRRIVEGYGKIHLWQQSSSSPLRHPYDVEAALLSSLRAGDFQGAETTLGSLFSMLGEMTPDDILHSVEQLCAVLSRFMRDSNIKRTSAGARGMFDELRSRETLWEMRAYLADVCRMITAETGSGAAALVERILDYVKTRFTTTIDFEEMARAVGISYSYMRRLVREQTGRSILEQIHAMRIEEAGRLLEDRGLPISSIARKLGYNNIQSFERFFKKYRGVSAHELRALLPDERTARRQA